MSGNDQSRGTVADTSMVSQNSSLDMFDDPEENVTAIAETDEDESSQDHPPPDVKKSRTDTAAEEEDGHRS